MGLAAPRIYAPTALGGGPWCREAMIASRLSVVKAFVMSTLRQTHWPSGGCAFTHSCTVMPASSHAPRPLKPNCVGRKRCRQLRVASDRIVRFQKSGEACRLRRLDRSGISRDAHSHFAVVSSMNPDSHCRAKRSSATRSRLTAPCWAVRRASCRCWGRRPEGPAEEAAGKSRMALSSVASLGRR